MKPKFEKLFLIINVFTKNYPTDRINGITQDKKRENWNLNFTEFFFSKCCNSQKLSQLSYEF